MRVSIYKLIALIFLLLIILMTLCGVIKYIDQEYNINELESNDEPVKYFPDINIIDENDNIEEKQNDNNDNQSYSYKELILKLLRLIWVVLLLVIYLLTLIVGYAIWKDE